jgi:hypothetical protein
MPCETLTRAAIAHSIDRCRRTISHGRSPGRAGRSHGTASETGRRSCSCTALPGPSTSGALTPRPSPLDSPFTSGTCPGTAAHRRTLRTPSTSASSLRCSRTCSGIGASNARMSSRMTTAALSPSAPGSSTGCSTNRSASSTWWHCGPGVHRSTRLVREHADVLQQLPPTVHRGAVEAYIRTASHKGLTDTDVEALVEPWTGELGQPALYRQIEQADERFTDEVEERYGEIDEPVHIIWGTETLGSRSTTRSDSTRPCPDLRSRSWMTRAT